MEDRLYKRGGVVKVWSLQSFHGGGFLNGKEGIVSQDQRGGSVLVAIERKLNGEDKIDISYEIYPEQVELVSIAPSDRTLIEKFNDLKEELKKDKGDGCGNRTVN